MDFLLNQQIMRLSKLKAVSIENPIRILFYKIELLQSSVLSWKKKTRLLMTVILQESFFRKVEVENLTALSTSNPKQSLLVDFRVEKLKESSSVNPQIFLQSRALLTVMVGSG